MWSDRVTWRHWLTPTAFQFRFLPATFSLSSLYRFFFCFLFVCCYLRRWSSGSHWFFFATANIKKNELQPQFTLCWCEVDEIEIQKKKKGTWSSEGRIDYSSWVIYPQVWEPSAQKKEKGWQKKFAKERHGTQTWSHSLLGNLPLPAKLGNLPPSLGNHYVQKKTKQCT